MAEKLAATQEIMQSFKAADKGPDRYRSATHTLSHTPCLAPRGAQPQGGRERKQGRLRWHAVCGATSTCEEAGGES